MYILTALEDSRGRLPGEVVILDFGVPRFDGLVSLYLVFGVTGPLTDRRGWLEGHRGRLDHHRRRYGVRGGEGRPGIRQSL